MQNLSVLLLFLLSFSLFAQEKKDTIQSEQLDEVHISGARLSRLNVDSSNISIDRATIEMMQPDDLGELMRKIPGAQVKSFGGLGGLKTVNIRGLNGQHTTLVVDGFQQINPQTGQANLANYHLDNIEEVIVQRGGNSELYVPVTAQLSGNAIILKSFQAVAPRIPLQQRIVSKFGSWNYTDNQFILKSGSKKFYGSGFIKYRKAEGSYPYEFMNYQTPIKGERTNNDFMDINGGINFSYSPHKSHKINTFLEYTSTSQGVPGAVVLYNPYIKQRLSTTSFNLRTDYKGTIKKINYRVYYSRIVDSLHYVDPHYLNAEGVLINDYRNGINDLGLNLSYSILKRFVLNAGSEWINSQLRSTNSLTARPVRNQVLSYLKATYYLENVSFIAQIGHQFIQEINRTGNSGENISKFTPFVEARWKIIKPLTFVTYYRNSFRPPSFNELYYNNIGSNTLKPEDAHQFSASFSYTIFDSKKTYFGLQFAGYHQIVDNMILSIPTKNTFVWSIQNIGKNKINGLETILSFSKDLGKGFSIQSIFNYTYQASRDFSDPNGPTYKNIIAYSPQHVLNLDFSFLFKTIGTRISTYYCSERYALNQNITSNLVDDFYTLDWSLFSNFKIDKNNSIKLQLNLKNITNVQYAYVKNYVMPGRQIQFTFVYAFL